MVKPAETDSEKINASGFPLQLAVLHSVSIIEPNKWKVLFNEHRWQFPKMENESGYESSDITRTGFCDVVLISEPESKLMPGFSPYPLDFRFVLNIECKKSSSGGSWKFLVPNSTGSSQSKCKAFTILKFSISPERYMAFASGNAGMAPLLNSDWHTMEVRPSSFSASYAVVRVDGNNVLDRIVSEVSLSTEALALEASSFLRADSEKNLVFFNVIVTNQELLVCEYDPQNLNISDGAIDGLSDSDLVIVPYIRYDKQVDSRILQSPSTSSPFGEYLHLGERKERTTFIVNSSHLKQFLEEFECRVFPSFEQG